MKKFMLPLILIGLLSSYSIAHEAEEKEVKSSEEIKTKQSSNEKKVSDIKHSGGTNSQGCHAGSRPYHCH